MATPTDLWEIEPHTEAKHKILRAYLDGWFPKIAQTFRNKGMSYVDAYAGPGIYKGGEPGSPQIALDRAHVWARREPGVAIRTLFIEQSPKFFSYLVDVVAEKYPASKRPSTLKIDLRNGDCRQLLTPALQQLGSIDDPIFVNFDGWGVDLPASLVRSIGRRGTAPEVLIFFNTSMFVRMAENQDFKTGDRLFGSALWREKVLGAEDTAEKKRRLVEEYRSVLRDAGFDYPVPFELVTADGNSYMLFFGTRSEDGVDLMKNAMWKVDSYSGSRFRDPRIPKQIPFAFEDEPDLDTLRDMIVGYLEAHGETSMKELQRYTRLETIYRAPHATEVVRQLKADKLLKSKNANMSYDKHVVWLVPQRPLMPGW